MHIAGMRDTTPLDRAIAAVGGEAEFCKQFGIKQRSLFYWRAGRLPAERAGQIAMITGVPVHELRPDIFPAPATQAAA